MGRLSPSMDSITFVLLIFVVVFLMPNHAAPVQETAASRYANEKGCYFMNQHYDTGHEIETNDPCMNCTCTGAALMCYLRVCPFVKPLGENCHMEKHVGDCCPKYWCPEVYPRVKLPQPDMGEKGCYLNGLHYEEGSRLPVDPLNPCHACYCIRNVSVCTNETCELHIPGCYPRYKIGSCCPASYACTEEAATTVPPSILDAETPAPGCNVDGILYEDGLEVPSNETCKKCYCMRHQVMCTAIECTAPGTNCVPHETLEGQCCPEKYDCPEDTQISEFATTHMISTEEEFLNLTTTRPPSTATSIPFSVTAEEDLAGKTTFTTMESEEMYSTTKGIRRIDEEGMITIVPGLDVEASTTEGTLMTVSGPRVPKITEVPEDMFTKPPRTTTAKPIFYPSKPIPGEGICRHENRTYQNKEQIESLDPCRENCTCVNSVVKCDVIVCALEPPTAGSKCKVKKLKNECCPKYVCEETEAPEKNVTEEMFTTDLFGNMTASEIATLEAETITEEMASESDIVSKPDESATATATEKPFSTTTSKEEFAVTDISVDGRIPTKSTVTEEVTEAVTTISTEEKEASETQFVPEKLSTTVSDTKSTSEAGTIITQFPTKEIDLTEAPHEAETLSTHSSTKEKDEEEFLTDESKKTTPGIKTTESLESVTSKVSTEDETIETTTTHQIEDTTTAKEFLADTLSTSGPAVDFTAKQTPTFETKATEEFETSSTLLVTDEKEIKITPEEPDSTITLDHRTTPLFLTTKEQEQAKVTEGEIQTVSEIKTTEESTSVQTPADKFDKTTPDVESKPTSTTVLEDQTVSTQPSKDKEDKTTTFIEKSETQLEMKTTSQMKDITTALPTKEDLEIEIEKKSTTTIDKTETVTITSVTGKEKVTTVIEEKKTESDSKITDEMKEIATQLPTTEKITPEKEGISTSTVALETETITATPAITEKEEIITTVAKEDKTELKVKVTDELQTITTLLPPKEEDVKTTDMLQNDSISTTITEMKAEAVTMPQSTTERIKTSTFAEESKIELETKTTEEVERLTTSLTIAEKDIKDLITLDKVDISTTEPETFTTTSSTFEKEKVPTIKEKAGTELERNITETMDEVTTSLPTKEKDTHTTVKFEDSSEVITETGLEAETAATLPKEENVEEIRTSTEESKTESETKVTDEKVFTQLPTKEKDLEVKVTSIKELEASTMSISEAETLFTSVSTESQEKTQDTEETGTTSEEKTTEEFISIMLPTDEKDIQTIEKDSTSTTKVIFEAETDATVESMEEKEKTPAIAEVSKTTVLESKPTQKIEDFTTSLSTKEEEIDSTVSPIEKTKFTVETVITDERKQSTLGTETTKTITSTHLSTDTKKEDGVKFTTKEISEAETVSTVSSIEEKQKVTHVTEPNATFVEMQTTVAAQSVTTQPLTKDTEMDFSPEDQHKTTGSELFVAETISTHMTTVEKDQINVTEEKTTTKDLFSTQLTTKEKEEVEISLAELDKSTTAETTEAQTVSMPVSMVGKEETSTIQDVSTTAAEKKMTDGIISSSALLPTEEGGIKSSITHEERAQLSTTTPLDSETTSLPVIEEKEQSSVTEHSETASEQEITKDIVVRPTTSQPTEEEDSGRKETPSKTDESTTETVLKETVPTPDKEQSEITKEASISEKKTTEAIETTSVPTEEKEVDIKVTLSEQIETATEEKEPEVIKTISALLPKELNETELQKTTYELIKTTTEGISDLEGISTLTSKDKKEQTIIITEETPVDMETKIATDQVEITTLLSSEENVTSEEEIKTTLSVVFEKESTFTLLTTGEKEKLNVTVEEDQAAKDSKTTEKMSIFTTDMTTDKIKVETSSEESTFTTQAIFEGETLTSSLSTKEKDETSILTEATHTITDAHATEEMKITASQFPTEKKDLESKEVTDEIIKATMTTVSKTETASLSTEKMKEITETIPVAFETEKTSGTSEMDAEIKVTPEEEMHETSTSDTLEAETISTLAPIDVKDENIITEAVTHTDLGEKTSEDEQFVSSRSPTEIVLTSSEMDKSTTISHFETDTHLTTQRIEVKEGINITETTPTIKESISESTITDIFTEKKDVQEITSKKGIESTTPTTFEKETLPTLLTSEEWEKSTVAEKDNHTASEASEEAKFVTSQMTADEKDEHDKTTQKETIKSTITTIFEAETLPTDLFTEETDKIGIITKATPSTVELKTTEKPEIDTTQVIADKKDTEIPITLEEKGNVTTTAISEAEASKPSVTEEEKIAEELTSVEAGITESLRTTTLRIPTEEKTVEVTFKETAPVFETESTSVSFSTEEKEKPSTTERQKVTAEPEATEDLKRFSTVKVESTTAISFEPDIAVTSQSVEEKKVTEVTDEMETSEEMKTTDTIKDGTTFLLTEKTDDKPTTKKDKFTTITAFGAETFSTAVATKDETEFKITEEERQTESTVDLTMKPFSKETTKLDLEITSPKIRTPTTVSILEAKNATISPVTIEEGKTSLVSKVTQTTAEPETTEETEEISTKLITDEEKDETKVTLTEKQEIVTMTTPEIISTTLTTKKKDESELEKSDITSKIETTEDLKTTKLPTETKEMEPKLTTMATVLEAETFTSSISAVDEGKTSTEGTESFTEVKTSEISTKEKTELKEEVTEKSIFDNKTISTSLTSEETIKTSVVTVPSETSTESEITDEAKRTSTQLTTDKTDLETKTTFIHEDETSTTGVSEAETVSAFTTTKEKEESKVSEKVQEVTTKTQTLIDENIFTTEFVPQKTKTDMSSKELEDFTTTSPSQTTITPLFKEKIDGITVNISETTSLETMSPKVPLELTSKITEKLLTDIQWSSPMFSTVTSTVLPPSETDEKFKITEIETVVPEHKVTDESSRTSTKFETVTFVDLKATAIPDFTDKHLKATMVTDERDVISSTTKHTGTAKDSTKIFSTSETTEVTTDMKFSEEAVSDKGFTTEIITGKVSAVEADDVQSFSASTESFDKITSKKTEPTYFSEETILEDKTTVPPASTETLESFSYESTIKLEAETEATIQKFNDSEPEEIVTQTEKSTLLDISTAKVSKDEVETTPKDKETPLTEKSDVSETMVDDLAFKKTELPVTMVNLEKISTMSPTITEKPIIPEIVSEKSEKVVNETTSTMLEFTTVTSISPIEKIQTTTISGLKDLDKGVTFGETDYTIHETDIVTDNTFTPMKHVPDSLVREKTTDLTTEIGEITIRPSSIVTEVSKNVTDQHKFTDEEAGMTMTVSISDIPIEKSTTEAIPIDGKTSTATLTEEKLKTTTLIVDFTKKEISTTSVTTAEANTSSRITELDKVTDQMKLSTSSFLDISTTPFSENLTIIHKEIDAEASSVPALTSKEVELASEVSILDEENEILARKTTISETSDVDKFTSAELTKVTESEIISHTSVTATVSPLSITKEKDFELTDIYKTETSTTQIPDKTLSDSDLSIRESSSSTILPIKETDILAETTNVSKESETTLKTKLPTEITTPETSDTIKERTLLPHRTELTPSDDMVTSTIMTEIPRKEDEKITHIQLSELSTIASPTAVEFQTTFSSELSKKDEKEDISTDGFGTSSTNEIDTKSDFPKTSIKTDFETSTKFEMTKFSKDVTKEEFVTETLKVETVSLTSIEDEKSTDKSVSADKEHTSTTLFEHDTEKPSVSTKTPFSTSVHSKEVSELISSSTILPTETTEKSVSSVTSQEEKLTTETQQAEEFESTKALLTDTSMLTEISHMNDTTKISQKQITSTQGMDETQTTTSTSRPTELAKDLSTTTSPEVTETTEKDYKTTKLETPTISVFIPEMVSETTSDIIKEMTMISETEAKQVSEKDLLSSTSEADIIGVITTDKFDGSTESSIETLQTTKTVIPIITSQTERKETSEPPLLIPGKIKTTLEVIDFTSESDREETVTSKPSTEAEISTKYVETTVETELKGKTLTTFSVSSEKPSILISHTSITTSPEKDQTPEMKLSTLDAETTSTEHSVITEETISSNATFAADAMIKHQTTIQTPTTSLKTGTSVLQEDVSTVFMEPKTTESEDIIRATIKKTTTETEIDVEIGNETTSEEEIGRSIFSTIATPDSKKSDFTTQSVPSILIETTHTSTLPPIKHTLTVTEKDDAVSTTETLEEETLSQEDKIFSTEKTIEVTTKAEKETSSERTTTYMITSDLTNTSLTTAKEFEKKTESTFTKEFTDKSRDTVEAETVTQQAETMTTAFDRKDKTTSLEETSETKQFTTEKTAFVTEGTETFATKLGTSISTEGRTESSEIKTVSVANETSTEPSEITDWLPESQISSRRDEKTDKITPEKEIKVTTKVLDTIPTTLEDSKTSPKPDTDMKTLGDASTTLTSFKIPAITEKTLITDTEESEMYSSTSREASTISGTTKTEELEEPFAKVTHKTEVPEKAVTTEFPEVIKEKSTISEDKMIFKSTDVTKESLEPKTTIEDEFKTDEMVSETPKSFEEKEKEISPEAHKTVSEMEFSTSPTIGTIVRSSVVFDTKKTKETDFESSLSTKDLDSETSTPHVTEKYSEEAEHVTSTTTIAPKMETEETTTFKPIMITDLKRKDFITEKEKETTPTSIEEDTTAPQVFEDDRQVTEDECTVNGTSYKDGEAIQTVDPCEKCHCSLGEIKCFKMLCKLPKENCTPKFDSSLACCPSSYECPEEDKEKASITISHSVTETDMTTPIPISFMFSTTPKYIASAVLVTKTEEDKERAKDETEILPTDQLATTEEILRTTESDISASIFTTDKIVSDTIDITGRKSTVQSEATESASDISVKEIITTKKDFEIPRVTGTSPKETELVSTTEIPKDIFETKEPTTLSMEGEESSEATSEKLATAVTPISTTVKKETDITDVTKQPTETPTTFDTVRTTFADVRKEKEDEISILLESTTISSSKSDEEIKKLPDLTTVSGITEISESTLKDSTETPSSITSELRTEVTEELSKEITTEHFEKETIREKTVSFDTTATTKIFDVTKDEEPILEEAETVKSSEESVTDYSKTTKILPFTEKVTAQTFTYMPSKLPKLDDMFTSTEPTVLETEKRQETTKDLEETEKAETMSSEISLITETDAQDMMKTPSTTVGIQDRISFDDKSRTPLVIDEKEQTGATLSEEEKFSPKGISETTEETRIKETTDAEIDKFSTTLSPIKDISITEHEKTTDYEISTEIFEANKTIDSRDQMRTVSTQQKETEFSPISTVFPSTTHEVRNETSIKDLTGDDQMGLGQKGDKTSSPTQEITSIPDRKLTDHEMKTEIPEITKTVESFDKNETMFTDVEEKEFPRVSTTFTPISNATMDSTEKSTKTQTLPSVTDTIFTFVATRFTDMMKGITELTTTKEEAEAIDLVTKEAVTASPLDVTAKHIEEVTPITLLTGSTDLDQTTIYEVITQEAETIKLKTKDLFTTFEDKTTTSKFSIETVKDTETTMQNITVSPQDMSGTSTAPTSISEYETIRKFTSESTKATDRESTEILKEKTQTPGPVIVENATFTEVISTVSADIEKSSTVLEVSTSSDDKETTSVPEKKSTDITEMSTILPETSPEVITRTNLTRDETSSIRTTQEIMSETTKIDITSFKTEEQTISSLSTEESAAETLLPQNESKVTSISPETKPTAIEFTTGREKISPVDETEIASRATRKDMELEVTPSSFTQTQKDFTTMPVPQVMNETDITLKETSATKTEPEAFTTSIETITGLPITKTTHKEGIIEKDITTMSVPQVMNETEITQKEPSPTKAEPEVFTTSIEAITGLPITKTTHKEGIAEKDITTMSVPQVMNKTEIIAKEASPTKAEPEAFTTSMETTTGSSISKTTHKEATTEKDITTMIVPQIMNETEITEEEASPTKSEAEAFTTSMKTTTELPIAKTTHKEDIPSVAEDIEAAKIPTGVTTETKSTERTSTHVASETDLTAERTMTTQKAEKNLTESVAAKTTFSPMLPTTVIVSSGETVETTVKPKITTVVEEAETTDLTFRKSPQTESTEQPKVSTLSTTEELSTTEYVTKATETTTMKEDPDYIIDENTCIFEGRIFQSAEQVPRADPCEFCFCFRGSIICLQQSCPPPAANCDQTTIPGYCCPRYECPVYVTSKNISAMSRRKGVTPIIIQRRIDKREVRRPMIEVRGCEYKGTFFEMGKTVTSASGPCLHCVCQEDGLMHCEPQPCKKPEPLMLKMNNNFFRRR